jgi:hypothetical protein
MSDAVPLPPRPDLDQYKKLARELHRAGDAGDDVRSWAVQWLERLKRSQNRELNAEQSARIVDEANAIERRWIALRKQRGGEGTSLTDAQFFLAREHGFPSWPKFAEHVRSLADGRSGVAQFEAAVDAIVSGDEQRLAALLRSNPLLLKTRSLREHRSTLLHYCSANGVEDYRQKTPANIVAIARLLLDAGADVNAESEAYGGRSTTLMLTATSVHPARAGVQIALLKLLLEDGAAMDVATSSDVAVCLRNGRGAAAEYLASCGARLDLEGAAGVGRLDVVGSFFGEDGEVRAPATRKQLVAGFGWACQFGRAQMVEFLLGHGVRADEALNAQAETGLHYAALDGQAEIVWLLLGRGASVHAVESRFHGTPLDWALHGWTHRAPEDDVRRYYETVDALVRAGAGRRELATKDLRMAAALRGEYAAESGT